MTKTCKMCGGEFKSIHKQTLYCSKYCQGQSKKKPRICINCKSIFMSKSKQQRFCSNACGVIFNQVTLYCAKCKESFKRPKSRIRHDVSYCSRECSDGSPKPSRVTSLKVECANCDTTFLRELNAIKERFNYCSHGCYGEHVAKLGLNRGENNGMYNASLTQKEREEGRKYTEYYAWRTSVFERDSYTCQCCLRKGVTLNAHHVQNYATHFELRTSVANGVTLCYGCHKGFHKKYGRFDNNELQLTEFIREISQYRAEPS